MAVEDTDVDDDLFGEDGPSNVEVAKDESLVLPQCEALHHHPTVAY